MKHGNRCAELAHERHVVLDDDNRDAFLMDGVDKRAGGPGFLRPHAGGGLVEQQEDRPHRERHADREPLPLAVRKLSHAAILGAGEVEPLQQPRDLRIHRLAREAVLERQLHVVAHGEVAIDAEVLKLDADPHMGAAVRLGARDVAAAKHDGALVRLDAAEQELEEGALAGAVGADDAAQRARLQGEVHAIDRADPAERLGEALGPEQGAVVRARPTAPPPVMPTPRARAAAAAPGSARPAP